MFEKIKNYLNGDNSQQEKLKESSPVFLRNMIETNEREMRYMLSNFDNTETYFYPNPNDRSVNLRKWDI